MPHLVGDHLILRGLQHVANSLGLLSLGQFGQKSALIADLTGEQAVRCQTGFQVPQQCGFAAAGRVAEDHKFALLNRKGYIPKRLLLALRVCKIYIFEWIAFHLFSSAQFSTTGIKQRIKYTN